MEINEVIEHITNGTGGGKAHLEAIRYLKKYKWIEKTLMCDCDCEGSNKRRDCFHCMDKKIEKIEIIIKE